MANEPQLTDEKRKAAEVAKNISSRHHAMLRDALQEAYHLFTEPVRVTEEDRLHGLSGILERRLSEGGIILDSTSPQKKNRVIDLLEQRLQALSTEELKKLGFSSGTVRIIRAGDVLDLSMLDKKGWVQAIR